MMKRITINDLADILKITRQAIEQRALKEKWDFEAGLNRMKLYYINSLPADIRERVIRYQLGINKDSIEEISRQYEIKVPSEKLNDPQIALKIKAIAEWIAVPNAPGKTERRREIAKYYGFDYTTIYRLVKKVKNDKPIVKSTKNYGTKIDGLDIHLRAWDEEAGRMAVGELLNNKRRHEEKLSLYNRIQQSAERRGLRVGSYSSFLALNKKISPAVKAYRDRGARGLREDIVPAIQRDFTAYRPMECLVGDQHKADYYCFDYNGDLATLELFCWLDFRTQLVWSAVAYKHYNRYTVGQALLNAVSWGLPEQIYTDWGKPEESNYIDQLRQQLIGIGIKAEGIRHTHAKVRHPQAKPIESWFGWLDRNLRNDRISGYCKRLNDARESELQQKELKELVIDGKLMFIDELVERIFAVIEKWNHHQFKNRGVDTSRTPMEIYEAETKERPVTTLSTDVLEYIFLPIVETTVKRSQVKIRHEILKSTLTYYDPELAHYGGEPVSVRYNPFDPSRVFIFNQKKQLICTANEWGTINPKIKDLVAGRIAQQNKLIKQIKELYRAHIPKTESVPRISRFQKEAEQVKTQSAERKVQSEMRVMRTQLEEEMPLQVMAGGQVHQNDGGQGYRKLNLEKEQKEVNFNPVFSLNMDRTIIEE